MLFITNKLVCIHLNDLITFVLIEGRHALNMFILSQYMLSVLECITIWYKD